MREKAVYLASERPSQGGRAKVPRLNKVFRLQRRLEAFHECELEVEVIETKEPQRPRKDPARDSEEGREDEASVEDSLGSSSEEEEVLNHKLGRHIVVKSNPLEGRDFASWAQTTRRRKPLPRDEAGGEVERFMEEYIVDLYPCARRLPRMAIESMTVKALGELRDEIAFQMDEIGRENWKEALLYIFEKGLFRC